MSNLAQKVSQAVSVSLQKLTSPNEKQFDGKTSLPAPNMQAALVPWQLPVNFAYPSVLGTNSSGPGSCGPAPEEARSRTLWPPNMAIPVKLWRNPHAALSDTHAVSVTAMPSGSSQSAVRQSEPKRVLKSPTKVPALLPRNDESATKSVEDVLTMKKAQNGTTLSSSAGTSPAAHTLTATRAGARPKSTICTLPDRGLVRVTVNPSKPGLRGARIIFTKESQIMGVPVVNPLNSMKVNSGNQTTEMGDRPRSSLLGKRPPAVVHVSSASPCRSTVRTPLEKMPASPSQPNANSAQSSNQSAASASVKMGKCGTLVSGKEQCGTMQPQAAGSPPPKQQEDDDSYGIKIVNVRSLAGTVKTGTIVKFMPQPAGGNDRDGINQAMTSTRTPEVHREKDGSPQKAPGLQASLASTCNLPVRASEQGNGVTELCSSQAIKGNSTFGSQILFKPSPSAGNASRNATPCSKSDKLEEAVRVVTECLLQDTESLSEGGRRALTSLIDFVKNEAPTAESKDKCQDKLPQHPSKISIKAEPTSPVRAVNGFVLNVQEDKRLENLASCQDNLPQHPSKLSIKVEPTSPGRPADDLVLNAWPDKRLENSASQCQNKPLQCPGKVVIRAQPTVQQKANLVVQTASSRASSQRPLRRIVITSDKAPVISSDQVKTGIEAFLVQNNISNNFFQDEVIKLHWDGKDVSTFHFLDMDSNQLPLLLEAPAPLKSKPAALASSAGSEAFGSAGITVSGGAQATGSGTTPPTVDTLPELSKASTSGPAMLMGYSAVRVKCVTDRHPVTLAPSGPTLATRATVPVEKQLCFMPRAIRYVRDTGEVVEKTLSPGQKVVPVVAPVKTKGVPLCPKPAGCLASPAAPAVSSGLHRDLMSAGAPAGLKTYSLKSRPPKPTAEEARCMPMTASRVVHVRMEPPKPKPQCSEAGRPERSEGSADMPRARPHRPAYPTASDDDTARILEPEVLLKVSDKIIQVKTQPDNTSSSSSTTSCSGEDWPPTTKVQKKPAPSCKRAASKSSVQREYRMRKRRRCSNKQKTVAPPPDDRHAETSGGNKMKIAIHSPNCIDRPCVVSMHHLNDCLMTKGFVNLASVKRRELFVLAQSPEVRLAPNKVVSVVKLSPRKTAPHHKVSVTHISENVPQGMETDSLECLLKEQLNNLVLLRKKYRKQSS